MQRSLSHPIHSVVSCLFQLFQLRNSHFLIHNIAFVIGFEVVLCLDLFCSDHHCGTDTPDINHWIFLDNCNHLPGVGSLTICCSEYRVPAVSVANTRPRRQDGKQRQ